MVNVKTAKTAKKGTIRMANRDGSTAEVEGYVLGWFGMDRRPGKGWRVSHLETGVVLFPFIAVSKDRAVEVLRELDSEDWSGGSWGKVHPEWKSDRLWGCVKRASELIWKKDEDGG